jgi:hypothetical protein
LLLSARVWKQRNIPKGGIWDLDAAHNDNDYICNFLTSKL